MIRLAIGFGALLLLTNLAHAQTSTKTPDAPTCVTINGKTTPSTCNSGTTLLAYIQTLGASKGGVLSGQTADPYSQNPMDVFVGSAPNWTVGAPGPATNLTPAILNLFVQGPDNGGSPTMQTLTGSESFVSIANAWIAAGGILHVSMAMGNPASPNAGGSWLSNPALAGCCGNNTIAASGNPWPDVLNSGTTTNKNFMANLAQIAALLKQINGAFLFVPWGEINSSNRQVDWYDNPQQPAQYAQLWQMTYNYLMADAGLAGKMLWGWDVGSGATGMSAWYPGDQYVDFTAIDSLSPPLGDSSGDPVATATYNELLAHNKPLFFASIGMSYNLPSAMSADNYQSICQQIANSFPAAFGYSMWAQTDALSSQNGAANCLSGPHMLNRSNLPKFNGKNK